jgi:hypothetical protein
MEQPTDPYAWISSLEGPGTGFLTPFTSEMTRKGGARLIIVSILTISLATKIVVVTEGSILGLKIDASQIPDITLFAGLACTYLFILYTFDLYGDWKANRLRD